MNKFLSRSALALWSGVVLLSPLGAHAQVNSFPDIGLKFPQIGVNSPPLLSRPIIYPPFRRPEPPRPTLNQELQLISEVARVEINGAVAKTYLTQTFQNTTNNRIEGTYVFPLPEGAAVSGFAMMVNGKLVQAEILNGDKAREIYNGIVAKMRDPAILEFVDRNLIRARIFPIEPRAEQKIELEYSESLKADAGSFRYVLPLRLPVGGAAQNASVDVKISSPLGIRAVYSPTHNVDIKRGETTARVTGEWGWKYPPASVQDVTLRREEALPNPRDNSGADRDFVLYYTADKARVGVNLITHQMAGEDGYFMLLAAPDSAVAPKEIPAKDAVFVLDTSGSMEGEKIEQARRALLTLIGNLNPNDRFNIVTFSSDVRTFRDGLIPASKENLDAARDWARAIKAVGGTNINDALIEGLKMLPQTERPQQMIFMTDGLPTVGETSIEQILKNARAANDTNQPTERKGELPFNSKARLFTFGVGYDVNTRLLDTLAEDNRGSSDYVLPQEDIEQKVGALYSKIAYPVLSNPRLDFGDMKVYDVYPKRLPDLFKGSQVVIFGRYDGKVGGAKVQLIGDSLGREERIQSQGDWTDKDNLNDTLPRLWATRKVGYLLDDARRSGRTVDPEVREEIIKLSKKYGIVTQFTAGLITEDERQLPPGTPIPLGAADAGGLNRNNLGGFGGALGTPGAPGPRGERGPAGSMAAARPAFNLPSSSSGVEAVRAAKESKALKDDGKVTNDQNVRYVEGKSFFLRGDVWVDSAYDAQKSPKPVTIKFASPDYFALAKDKSIAKWLSVGDKVLLVLPNKVVQIEL
ncbi:MAG TPA: VIT domain-containing protein [Abditibacteriaceae bacterium]